MNSYLKVLVLIAGAGLLGACDRAESTNSKPTVLRGAPAHGDSQRGAVIADKWCAGCHAEGPVMRDNAPTFAALAASQRTEGAIRAFLMQPHAPMPPLSLSGQEIEDILAYLQSIKAAGRP